MRTLTTLTVMTFFVLFVAWSDISAGEGKKTIKATQRHSGKIADASLKNHAPKNGVINNQKSLETLWDAWKVKGDAPKLEFKTYLVVVHLAGGPNLPGASYMLDANGDLRAKVQQTLIGGPGFGYSIEVLPRDGIKTYQGKPIE
jgi:hypothetical protein